MSNKKKVSARKIDDVPNNVILSSAQVLNSVIMKLDEKRVLALLKHEQNNLRRPSILDRIYSRYNRLRAAREREEL